MQKVIVFFRFWPLFGPWRTLGTVKLGSTWGQSRNFSEVCRYSSSISSSEHFMMASRSRSFGFGRPKRSQEGPKGAPKRPQEGGTEGGKMGYEIGLELEGLFGPILEPFGGSFWCHLGAILRPLWCPHGSSWGQLACLLPKRTA